jgi:glycosyltransferase involved in cell wall biosynthesis
MGMSEVQLSIIVAVGERSEGVVDLYPAYREAASRTGLSYQFIYVIDGDYAGILQGLKALKQQGEPIVIVNFARYFGEATAIKVGFEHSQGPVILTLPAYEQLETGAIVEVVEALRQNKHTDMVLAQRWPRIDGRFNRLQAGVFDRLLSALTGFPYKDIGCSVRAFRRQVLEEVELYGDMHRFLPLLAFQRGFQIEQIRVAQARSDANTRIHAPGVYVRRALDLLTVVFLVKFNKKPLRFFGLLGFAAFAIGFAGLLYVIIERLFFDVPLADRPALLLSMLLAVLGVQLGAIGLVGETIIFTHARDVKEYTIKEIIN